jgi:hypothetical protein
MSLDLPEPNELVLSLDCGITLVEKTKVFGLFKCALQNREIYHVLFKDSDIVDIINFLPETLFMENMSKIEAEDASNGDTRGADMVKNTAALFTRFRPTVTLKDTEKPPVKNVVTTYHIHVWPQYVGFDLSLYSGRKKILIMPLIVAARFKAMAESVLTKSTSAMIERGYMNRA